MKAGHRIGLAALLLGAAAGGAWWWMVRSSTPPHIEQTDGSLPPAAETMAPATMVGTAESPVPALNIGEYRADTSGLPPIDAPLAAQIPALRDAAARGNATAACRLAVIGMTCGTLRALRITPSPSESSATARELEESLRQQFANVSLDGLPERYRRHAQRRLDTEALMEHDRMQRMGEWGERCEGAPVIAQVESMAALRQAALAGEPGSMVRYAHGLWAVEFAIGSFGLGFHQRDARSAWMRTRGFEDWQRDATAIRRASLERGDPEMLWMEFAFADRSGLRLLEPGDPVETAAALRAYAALVSDGPPESTSTLGLTAEQSAEADRRADAWAARARERGRQDDEVTENLIAPELSSCE